MTEPRGLFIGLLSGTSVDAIDCALVEIDHRVQLLHSREYPIPEAIREEIAAISHSGDREIERMGILDRQLGQLLGTAANQLIAAAGVTAPEVTAIGSHGQTIRHRPASGGHAPETSFTLQIGDPNSIAELTGITTVADFRRRDMAAGGEGAPLAPAFHAHAFAAPDTRRAIVNIGGIANISLLDGARLIAGFDSGPGNTLMDHWIARHRGQHFDRDGQWAASGRVDPGLLRVLLQHPYLQRSGPRSTGKEAFNLAWLDAILGASPATAAQDVQATLCEFTAASIAAPILQAAVPVDEIYICGGGAHNRDLMGRLARLLAPRAVGDTDALGIHPDWVEAAAFAWLAQRRLGGLPGNAPIVTGAKGERVLGAIYPGMFSD
ncbi:anhydro-N-acetylmuramic acid kinase [Haliea sp. E17]|uniref:anhydro-N-acetylmuramic acid kinase n=1 Tax=Haliea sp. E17 TaxID=3401576 RepID=UPI003AAE0792